MISIIIAVYNSERTIGKCIQSILEQTFKDFEIICIDDGSTDNSRNIIKQFNNEKIVYNYKTNGGASSARNVGLSLAKGDYICIVDSDDFISENSLELLYQSIISKKNIDAALFDLYFVEQNGELNNLDMSSIPMIISGRDAAIEAIIWNVHGLCLYKKKLFEKISFDETNIHGDELTTRIILSKCEKIIKTDAKYFYIQHANATTIKFSLKRFGIADNLVNSYSYYSSNNMISEKAKCYFNIEFSRVFIGLVKLFYLNRAMISSDEKSVIIEKLIKLHDSVDINFSEIIKNKIYKPRIKVYLFFIKLNFKSILRLINVK